MTERVVVAGASLGGLRAAEQLRAAGWRGEILVVGAEPHRPYNRPPLSKEVLAGRAGVESLTFRPRASAADVRWRLGTPVTSADLSARVVRLADGARIDFAGLVIATGLRPRRLRCPGPLEGRHALRTVDDAITLRAALRAARSRPGARVVVVGAGFIGCEVAATARGLGVAEVTVVDPEPLPMLRPLGELLARELLTRHQERGVRFALGRGVAAFTGTHRVTGVELSDGTVLAADVVVEAVGSVANTEWLAGNDLDLTDGVRVDDQLRAGGRAQVVAVGDVARFPNPRYDGVPRRVEHWSIPADSAKHAARTLAAHLAGGPPPATPFAPLPTFWSDQHDLRLQSFGAPALGTEDVRILDGQRGAELVVGYHRDGRLVGVAALGGAGAVGAAARYRAELASQPVAA